MDCFAGGAFPMTLAQLRYLLAIVDAKLNITLAAERVNATQPGISKQVKLLEDQLGFQIFVRRGKSLERVSPAGEQIIERARVIVAEAANIQTIAANQRRESAGELVIATTRTQAQFVLPPALKRLKAKYPAVSVRLNLFADPARAATAREDADLMVASSVARPGGSELVIPLYRWERVAVVPRDHAFARLNRPLTLAELATQPLIGYESALGSHASVAEAFAQAGSPAQFAYAAHDTEVITTYVRSGLGVGLLAEMAAADDDELVSLPVEGLPACHAYAILRRDRVARDYVVDFLDSLAPHVSRRELERSLHPSGKTEITQAPDWADWLRAVKPLLAAADAAAAA